MSFAEFALATGGHIVVKFLHSLTSSVVSPQRTSAAFFFAADLADSYATRYPYRPARS